MGWEAAACERVWWARPMLTVPSLPQIGVWYSNRTLAMNATTLDINLSQTLANKTLVVTTILVSGPLGVLRWLAVYT